MIQLMRFVQRWRTPLLLLAFAVLTTIGHPGWSVFAAGWIALVPLLFAIREAGSWKRAAWIGWLAGFLSFLGIIGWLYSIGKYTGVGLPLGWIIAGFGAAALAAYLALYVALFSALVVALLPRRGWGYLLGVPILWVATEWLRGWMLTGFPWGGLGHTQWNDLVIAQLAAVGGVPLVSLLLALVNATIANALFRRSNGSRARVEAAPAALAVAAALVYGVVALNTLPAPTGSFRVAIVPGNVPQDRRWSRAALVENLDHYLGLMARATDEKPDLIVLPETSVLLQYLKPEEQQRFFDFVKARGIPILFGMPRFSQRGTLREGYNSAILLSPDGRILGEYHKQHLVPFGEYIPFRNLLPGFLVDRVIGVADYNFGRESNTLNATIAGRDVRIGVPICFESVFPGISREFVQNGANLLAVITNDGWYSGTAAIPQHNAFSVFRAIETRRAVVRAANRGISTFIDPSGRMSSERVAADDPDRVIVSTVPLMIGETLYTRLGDWVSVLSALVAAGLIVWAAIRRRRRDGVQDKSD